MYGGSQVDSNECRSIWTIRRLEFHNLDLQLLDQWRSTLVGRIKELRPQFARDQVIPLHEPRLDDNLRPNNSDLPTGWYLVGEKQARTTSERRQVVTSPAEPRLSTSPTKPEILED